MKQETGNENIQCEKIILQIIKGQNNNRKEAEEDLKPSRSEESRLVTSFETQAGDIKANNIENTNDNNNNEKDNKQTETVEQKLINYNEYFSRIETFVDSEVNHLKKLKAILHDFKSREFNNKNYSSKNHNEIFNNNNNYNKKLKQYDDLGELNNFKNRRLRGNLIFFL